MGACLGKSTNGDSHKEENSKQQRNERKKKVAVQSKPGQINKRF